MTRGEKREANGARLSGAAQSERVYRHPVFVRLWHWLNVLCLLILLLSGFQIFNAHPRLYLGLTGYYDVAAVFEITGATIDGRDRSWIQAGALRIPTTGVLGGEEENAYGLTKRLAFPAWLRLPAKDDLAAGRGWHFLFAWIFVFNGAAYVAAGLWTGRFRRVLTPKRAQLTRRAILSDLWMHLRLKHATGAAALDYNLLQKIAYLAVIFLMLPLMVLTGMSMSNSAVAMFHWLPDVFGGRQSARTLHFICAIGLVAFVFVHLFQVVVAGFGREMRSILTGYYEPRKERP